MAAAACAASPVKTRRKSGGGGGIGVGAAALAAASQSTVAFVDAIIAAGIKTVAFSFDGVMHPCPPEMDGSPGHGAIYTTGWNSPLADGWLELACEIARRKPSIHGLARPITMAIVSSNDASNVIGEFCFVLIVA